MASNRAKGRRREKQASDTLIKQGYTTQLAPPATRFAKQTDMFGGLWDIIAVGKQDIRFIQVKSNQTAPPAWREKALKWNCPKWATKEIWIYKKGSSTPEIRVMG